MMMMIIIIININNSNGGGGGGVRSGPDDVGEVVVVLPVLVEADEEVDHDLHLPVGGG